MGELIKRILSWFLVLAGVYCLYFGIRDYYSTFSAQSEMAEAWKNVRRTIPSPPGNIPKRSAPKALPQPQSQPELRLGETVARLSVPRLQKSLFIIEGTDLADLKKAPGHMHGTALPGQNGNCVIAAHRDTHFRFLKDIQIGDEIVLETRQGRFRYRVRGTNIVFPTNTASLRDTSKPVLHLITCYPFYYVGSAPKRFIVQADLETAPERQQAAD